MKLLLENLEGFITFLVETESKNLFYAVKVEVSDLTETPNSIGRLHRATIILQAPTKQGLAIHLKGFEQFVSTEKEAKKFTKTIEENITKLLDAVKKRVTDITIYKGVVEL